jgi:hypothetical protein
MKNRDIYQYSEISSFEDFRLEKERLILKRKLVETRLNISYLQFSEVFSVSNLMFSSVKEFIFPKIADFLGGLKIKVEDDGMK